MEIWEEKVDGEGVMVEWKLNEEEEEEVERKEKGNYVEEDVRGEGR